MAGFKILRHRRRSIILLLMDITILFISVVLCAYTVRMPGEIDWPQALRCWGTITVLLLVYTALLHTNLHVWKYAGSLELVTLINAYMLAGLTGALIEHLFHAGMPLWLMGSSTALAALGSTYARTLYRSLVRGTIAPRVDGRRPLAIIGAGSAGVMLSGELTRNKNSGFSVWGFFDDDPDKIGMTIAGVKVLGDISSLPEALRSADIQDVVLAIPSLGLGRRREIISLCRSLKCRLKIMPEIIMTMDASENRLTKSMRYVRTEDLLGRSTIVFKAAEMADFLRGRTVLVTGGGGSIGSELCRQIAIAAADTIVVFDVNENNSYMLQNEIRQRISGDVNVVVEIGSMVNERRVQDVFDRYRPQVVFHAAAHKHVPLMEHCPYEAVWNNVFGTYNVIMAAAAHGVKKMVLISTDKAVNPTSIMGATKRYCEDLMRACSARPGNATSFVSVRFGNVLGSDGSVVPIFQDQIAHGGPVTVTDKRMTRYFMTITEAVGLVLKSGAMAECSETYILDMGKPMNILEMAENLIRLSGLEPYRDIQIVETGLRPGEKLFEELLVNDDRHIATRESKIFIERVVDSPDWATVQFQLGQLRAAVSSADSARVLELMGRFVPGYGAAGGSPAAGNPARGGRPRPGLWAAPTGGAVS